ncbi:MAG TPA: DUF2148 domain-containing protein [Methanoregula sp.]|nr:DUF2148 domain-containing protein [Methanoregula sp.]
MSPERDALTTVAGLMALAARTAPKGKGIDTIIIRVITGKDLRALAKRLDTLGTERDIGFFHRDAGNLAASDACVLIGSQGDVVAGVNCGACGFPGCAEMAAVSEKRTGKPRYFSGPNCAVRMADLGIAVGSAVKTAQIHNADNRVMYSAGVAAMDLGLLGAECTVAYGIPLSATGKNMYFDRAPGPEKRK